MSPAHQVVQAESVIRWTIMGDNMAQCAFYTMLKCGSSEASCHSAMHGSDLRTEHVIAAAAAQSEHRSVPSDQALQKRNVELPAYDRSMLADVMKRRERATRPPT